MLPVDDDDDDDIWTTHKAYLMVFVFITLQNLVVINATVLVMFLGFFCIFEPRFTGMFCIL